ncbi:MAG: trimeric intracellular cation channel family protein, partial [Lutibacter sp.]
MNFFTILDIIGTFAFAVSGALVAINKKFDPFGIFIIGFVTAVGGGTLRDVLTGHLPVNWMTQINYFYTIIIAVITAIFFRKKLKYVRKSLFLFDTIGLGIFTIIGTKVGLALNLHFLITIALGTMTGAFGGVIRDILCNEIPIIFRKEIYATACVIGSATFIGLHLFNINNTLNYFITILIVILIRIVAVKFHLTLPT